VLRIAPEIELRPGTSPSKYTQNAYPGQHKVHFYNMPGLDGQTVPRRYSLTQGRSMLEFYILLSPILAMYREEPTPMKRFFTHAIAAWTLIGAGLAGVTTRPVAAANEAFRQADHSLSEALAMGDKKAAAALLDDNFQWVDANGKMHTRAQVLENLAPLAADNEGAMDVRTLDLLGQAERVLGIHHNERFAHLWVKRPAGWQAILFLNIPIPEEREEPGVVPKPPTDPNADCDNPCRTLPFKPENAAQQGAMEAWFHLKTAEWHPDPVDWEAHADANHETISPRDDLRKLDHVVQLAQQRKVYGEKGADPGQPVMSMRMYDVGNVVIQECLQGPKGATKPTTFVTRVFVNRGDGWKITLSAATNIK
jgi:hypothetical protein